MHIPVLLLLFPAIARIASAYGHPEIDLDARGPAQLDPELELRSLYDAPLDTLASRDYSNLYARGAALETEALLAARDIIDRVLEARAKPDPMGPNKPSIAKAWQKAEQASSKEMMRQMTGDSIQFELMEQCVRHNTNGRIYYSAKSNIKPLPDAPCVLMSNGNFKNYPNRHYS